jgi:hypothetical protein
MLRKDKTVLTVSLDVVKTVETVFHSSTVANTLLKQGVNEEV